MRLRDSLEHALAYSGRYNAGGAYLVIGVDKLAMINNAYGYEAGDGILIAVGQRLDRCLRTSDVIGRIGADRFGVVLARCSDEQMARAADRILAAVREEPVDAAGTRVHVTVSIRSEERRVGNGCVCTCRSRWSTYPYKKKKRI